jgi:general secretion pathway protein H
MASPAATAKMPISRTEAQALSTGRRSSARGFTLLELMIVVAITGMASAAVALALRDSTQTQLDREAQRLVALLESARAESRATGVPLQWRATATGFEVWDGHRSRPQRWEGLGLQARSDTSVPLGPEPVIGPQTIQISSRDAPDRSLWVVSDGLRAFEVRNAPPGPATGSTP